MYLYFFFLVFHSHPFCLFCLPVDCLLIPMLEGLRDVGDFWGHPTFGVCVLSSCVCVCVCFCVRVSAFVCACVQECVFVCMPVLHTVFDAPCALYSTERPG